MRLLKQMSKGEGGYALAAVLVLLLVGSLITVPLLSFMVTGLKATELYEEKVFELYAADSGLEDAFHKIINEDASIADLDEEDTYLYSLPKPINTECINRIISFTIND